MKQSNDGTSLSMRINSFLSRRWKTVTFLLVSVIITMAAILVFDSMQKRNRNDSAELAEDIQELFDEWIQEKPEERDDTELVEKIELALTDYPRLFVAQRAFFTRGLMAYENQKWPEAVESFNELISRWKKSYLVPIALFNIASAQEQSGNIEGARKYWSDLVEQFSEASPYVPEALFNLGRIAETEKDIETALKHYEKIISRYPESKWSRITRNRVIILGK